MLSGVQREGALGLQRNKRQRLRVRPGVAGWAQLHGRNSWPWSQRIGYDIDYAQRVSLRLDLKILWRTVPMVVRGSGILEGQRPEDVDDLAPQAST